MLQDSVLDEDESANLLSILRSFGDLELARAVTASAFLTQVPTLCGPNPAV